MAKMRYTLAVGLLLLLIAAQGESKEKRRDSINDGNVSSHFLKSFRLNHLYSKLKRHKVSDDSSQPRLRFKRQQSTYHQVHLQIGTCEDQSDCIPPEYQGHNIPSSLINCENDVCVCKDCFVKVNDTCALDSCKVYDVVDKICEDQRKSQKTAFLLSLFLSSVGAANFYIGQTVLAGIQLGIFVLGLLVVFLMFYLLCCCVIFIDDFEDLCEDCFICGAISSALCLAASIFFILLAIAIWWIIDLTYFVLNGRGDGYGCPLLADL